jgi:hypothetical protein
LDGALAVIASHRASLDALWLLAMTIPPEWPMLQRPGLLSLDVAKANGSNDNFLQKIRN